MPDNSGLDQLDSEKNAQFHWKVQRVRKAAAVLTFLILAAAVLGLFGSGSLSSVETAAPDSSLRIQYSRFARLDSPIDLVLRLSPSENESHIEIENRYLDHFEIEAVSPPPLRIRLAADHTVYVFETIRSESGLVTIRMRAQDFGSVSGWIKTSTGQTIRLSQFIYP